MRPALASADLRITHALRILISGFPTFAGQEFRRARDAISPPVPEDLAQAIISDCLLILSQLGAAMAERSASPGKPPLESQLVSILAAFQAGDDSRAVLMIANLDGERRDGWTMSLRVLAKRLLFSGIELRPAAREQAPTTAGPPVDGAARPFLRLVWSDGRRVG